jgi:heme-degrading monooxygenase HmoA
MFVRIVKMSFHEEKISKFLENFEFIKEKIRNAPGNRLLELYQDKSDQTIFFTYSYWETEQDLENYRNSELFSKFGPIQKNYLIINPKRGASINWSVCSSRFK